MEPSTWCRNDVRRHSTWCSQDMHILSADTVEVTYGQDATLEQQPNDPEARPDEPLPILIRATNGKSRERASAKIKLSTIVEADALGEFFAKYAEICKAGMPTLKPRDKSKKKAKAKKRKTGTAAPL
jgi:signal recognition particle subunit SRP14